MQVTNAAGQPFPGAKVTWHTTAEGAVVRPDTATTDANGIARAEYSPGWNLGPQAVTARVGEASATVTVTATGMRLTTVTQAMQRVCGLDSTGRLWCWTRTDRDAAPIKLAADRRPVPSPTSARFTRLHGAEFPNAALSPLCGVTTTATLLCASFWDVSWSEQNPFSRSLAPPMAPNAAASVFPSPGFPVKDVTLHQARASTICVLDMSDALWCWGRNAEGQFGNGTTGWTTSWLPAAPGLRWRQITTNEDRSVCGLTLDGAVYCWSLGSGPILGQPFNAVITTPQRIPYPLPPLLAISHAESAICGIATEGQRHLCWGNWYLATVTPSRDPASLPGMPTSAQSIGGSPGHALLVSGGRLLRFGHNFTTANAAVPGLTGVVRLLTTVGNYWCVEHEGGAVLCGAGTSRPVAVPLPAGP